MITSDNNCERLSVGEDSHMHINFIAHVIKYYIQLSFGLFPSALA